MSTSAVLRPTRRAVLAAALAVPGAALARAPSIGRLRFKIFRNGTPIGEQEMTFSGGTGAMMVTTDVAMAVKLGPVPVFRYTHDAREQWRAGRFEQIETTTTSNGKREQVVARRAGGTLQIETLTGATTASSQAAPMTHWNSDVFAGPLFNPQTGALLKVVTTRGDAQAVPGGGRAASRWIVRGAAEIEDWYDQDGVWTALRGRLKDGSILEYWRDA